MKPYKLLMGVAVLALAGCSSDPETDGRTTDGTGGAPPTSGSWFSTGTDSGASTMFGASSSSGEAPHYECSPTAKCTSVASDCLALSDNAGAARADLRMSQLTITKPDALSGGLVASVVGDSVVLKSADCRLSGTGLFSWLLRFDFDAKTLTIGGANPASDPHDGYCFRLAPAFGGDVAPTTIAAQIADDGSFSATAKADQVVSVPIFLDNAATSGFLFQLHEAQITDAKLDSNNNCIGSYNAADLQIANKCTPEQSEGGTYFTEGAKMEAYILAEEADKSVIETLHKSLCALLVDPSDTEKPEDTTVCKRDAGGKVTAKGDWCSKTNSAASADCADAFAFRASFAASAIKVNDACP